MPVYVTEEGQYRPAWNGDTYSGRRTYISDSERSSHLDDAVERLKRSCKDPGDADAASLAYEAWIEGEYCKVAQEAYKAASRTGNRVPRSELEDLRTEMERRCSR
jgi:hypothetical protein